jgi:hypothetical protein
VLFGIQQISKTDLSVAKLLESEIDLIFSLKLINPYRNDEKRHLYGKTVSPKTVLIAHWTFFQMITIGVI